MAEMRRPMDFWKGMVSYRTLLEFYLILTSRPIDLGTGPHIHGIFDVWSLYLRLLPAFF